MVRDAATLINDLNNLRTSLARLENERQVLVYGGYLRGEVEMDFHSVLNAVRDEIVRLEAALKERRFDPFTY